MRITYDASVDALAVELAPKARSVRTQVLAHDIHVDWDANDRPITIEILGASTFYSRTVLEQLATPDTMMLLAVAAKESGLQASTLRSLVNDGVLRGVKVGRDWTVSYQELLNYMQNRKPQGRPPKNRKARRVIVRVR